MDYQEGILDLFNYVDLLGKEFESGGRGPDKYDCYGLCMEIYRRNDIELPDFGYKTTADAIDKLVRESKGYFKRIDKPQELCLVTFYIRYPYVSHVGVVLKPPYFINILERSFVTVERLDSISWRKRVEGYYLWET